MAERMPTGSAEQQPTQEDLERQKIAEQEQKRQEFVDAKTAVKNEEEINKILDGVPLKLAKSGNFPRKKGEDQAQYLERLKELAGTDIQLLTRDEVADIFENGIHDNTDSRVLEAFPKLEDEDQVAYEQRIMGAFKKTEYDHDYQSRFNNPDVGRTIGHNVFAETVSYNLYLGQLEADKAKYPRENGMDQSAWRAKYGIPDRDTWVRGEQGRKDLDREVRLEVQKVTGSMDDSRMSIGELRNYAETKISQREGMDDASAYLGKVKELMKLDFSREQIESSDPDMRAVYMKLRELTNENLPREGESEQDYQDRLVGLLIAEGSETNTEGGEPVNPAENPVDSPAENPSGNPEDTPNYEDLDVDTLLAAVNDRMSEDPKFKEYVEGLGLNALDLKSMPAEGLASLMRFESEDDEEDNLEDLDVDELLAMAYDRMKNDPDFKKYLEDLGYDELALKSMPAEGLRSLLAHKSETAGDDSGEEGELDVDTLLAAVYDRLNEDPKFKEYVEGLGLNLLDLKSMPAEGLKSLLAFESEDDDAEDGEEGEKDEKLDELERAEKLREKIDEMINDDPDFAKYIKDKLGNSSEIDKLNSDELQELIDNYESDKNYEELEKAEKLREQIAEMIADDPDFAKYIKDKLGNSSEIDKLNSKELQELIDGYKKETGGGEEEPVGGGEQEKKPERISVVELDATKDAEELAHDIAMRRFGEFINEKHGVRGMLRKFVFSDLFREAKIVQFEREAAEDIRVKGLSAAGIERFTNAFARDAEETMIHSDRGEHASAYTVMTDEEGNEYVSRKYRNENGEYVTERLGDDDEMAKQTIGLRNLIKKYASEKGKFDRDKFRDEVEELRRGEKDSDRAFSIDNYAEIIEGLKGFNENAEGLNNALDGFTYINGEARRSVASEIHRDALDNITHKLINGRIGRFVPPELVAIGTSAAYAAFTKGASTASRAILPLVGGSAAAAAFAGLKERDRVTTERATAERQKAMGEQIEAKSGRYTREMWDSLQTMESASELTSTLAGNLESINNSELSADDRKAALGALMLHLSEVEAAVRVTDTTGHDMIRYNVGAVEGGMEGETRDVIASRIEQERLAMDIARAEARKALLDNPEAFGITEGTDEEKKQKVLEKLDELVGKREEVLMEGSEDEDDIEQGLNAAESAFKSLRRKRVVGRMAKTAALTFTFSLATQEGVAAFSDNRHGIIDHLTGHQDNPTAKSTFLAGVFNMKQEQVIPGAILESNAELTADQIKNYRNSGAIVSESSRGSRTITETISESDNYSTNGTNMSVHRTWLDNNTSAYDRNELGLRMSSDGTVSTNFFGDATHGSRAVEAFGNGDMKALVTIGGHKYVLDGVMENGQMDFGDSARSLGIDGYLSNGQFDYVEAFVDNGVAGDGGHNIDVFATIVGDHGTPGDRVIEKVVETVKYNVVNPDQTVTIDNGVANVIPISFFKRKGLENANAGKRDKTPEVPGYDPNGGGEIIDVYTTDEITGGGETPPPQREASRLVNPTERPNGDSGETPAETPTETVTETSEEAPETPVETPAETESGSGESSSESSEEAESEEELSPAEVYREYLASQFIDGSQTSDRNVAYPHTGNVVVANNYSQIVENNGERVQSLRNNGGELAQVDIDNYNMPIVADEATIQAYAERTKNVSAENISEGIKIWNSLSDTNRERFLTGKVGVEGLDSLVRAGILNPFNPREMARAASLDVARFHRNNDQGGELRDGTSFHYDAESKIPFEESVFKDTSIDSSNPEGSIRAEIEKVDHDMMEQYVSNYFKDGYNLPDTARRGGREFMRAAQTWDKFVPTDIKKQVLEGGNAETLIGGGWGYWVNVFDEMNLIKISKENENSESAAAENLENAA